MKKIITLIVVALAMTMSINAADTFINGVKYSGATKISYTNTHIKEQTEQRY